MPGKEVIVSDFTIGSDILTIKSYQNIDTINDITIIDHTTYTQLQLHNDVIKLYGITSADLSESDFIFA